MMMLDKTYDPRALYGRLIGIGLPDAEVTYAYTPDSLDAGYSVLTSSNAILSRVLYRDPQRRGLIASVSNLVNGVDSGSSFDYTYDALGRPVTRNLDAFGYNARGEVAWARYGTNIIADLYFYDWIGNFISNYIHGAWTQFEANELNEYVTISDTTSRSLNYDLDGNLLTNGVCSYSYNSENRLATIASNGVEISVYVYDARARRSQTYSGGCDVQYFHDGWNTLLEKRSTLAITRTVPFFWGKDLSGRFQGEGGVGGLLCSYENEGPHFPNYDNNGNVVGYFDAKGRRIMEYAYNVFGDNICSIKLSKPSFARQFSTKPSASSSLYDFGYRYYSISLNRWISRDRIYEAGGINLYSFVENSSCYNYDELGLHSASECDDDYENCCHRCKRFNTKARRAICYAECATKYGTCLATAEETLVIAGTVIVAGVVIYVCPPAIPALAL